MKQRQADRETEEAARAAAKVRVRLDDDDDRYGGGMTRNPFPHEMVEFHNEPPVMTGGLDPNIGDDHGFGDFDHDGGYNYLENGDPSTGPWRQPTCAE